MPVSRFVKVLIANLISILIFQSAMASGNPLGEFKKGDVAQTIAAPESCLTTLMSDEDLLKAFPPPDKKDGLTGKGFISAWPNASAIDGRLPGLYQELGYIPWYIGVMIVKSPEEALKNHILFNNFHLMDYDTLNVRVDPLIKNLYLILPEVDSNSLDQATAEASAKNHIHTARLVFFKEAEEYSPETSKQYSIVDVPTNDRRWRFNINNLKTVFDPRMNAPIVRFNGWAYASNRGMLWVKALEESETFKKLSYEARQYHNKGFRFYINRDLDAALDLLKRQKRKGQSVGMNRYLDKKTEDEMRAKFARGEAYTIETYYNGQLVGGIIGAMKGSFVNIDSIFNEDLYLDEAGGFHIYDEDKMPLLTIDEKTGQYRVLTNDEKKRQAQFYFENPNASESNNEPKNILFSERSGLTPTQPTIVPRMPISLIREDQPKLQTFIEVDDPQNPGTKKVIPYRGRSGVIFSRISVLILAEYLKKFGIPFNDMGMVSAYSSSVKTEYYPAEEFEKHKSELPHVTFVLPSNEEWIPAKAMSTQEQKAAAREARKPNSGKATDKSK